MAVRKTNPMYEASDGREFEKKEDAERYDKLLVANRDFERAKGIRDRALTETQKTADGEPFSICTGNYYAIIKAYQGEPEIRELSFYNTETIHIHGDGGVAIKPYGNYGEWMPRIDELYRWKDNAVKQLTKELFVFRKEIEKRIERLNEKG